MAEPDNEELNDLYARLDSIEERYEEIAEALGVVLTYPSKQHDEILARARECKGAHDYFYRKPVTDIY